MNPGFKVTLSEMYDKGESVWLTGLLDNYSRKIL